MKKMISIGLALLLLSFAPGNQILEDLKQINKKMYEANVYRITTRLVMDYNGNEKVSTARSMKLGTFFTYAYQGNVFLSNKKVQLFVNAENKTILVQDNGQDNQAGRKDFSVYVQAVDSLLQKGQQYKPVKRQGDYQTIKTSFGPDELYTALELTYDSKKCCFKSFEYTCGKKLRETGLHRIRVVYDEFNFEPGITAKDFSEEKYIVMKGKKITGPSEKYKGYKVIDQRLDP